MAAYWAGSEAACLADATLPVFLPVASAGHVHLGNEGSRGLAVVARCVYTNRPVLPKPNTSRHVQIFYHAILARVSGAAFNIDMSMPGSALAPGHAATGGCQRVWFKGHASSGTNQCTCRTS